MSQEVEVPWEHCKIVEENENGKLVVLEDNVKNILKQVGKQYGGKGDTAIVILSVGGSRASGKSVLTNILMKYLESSKSWSTEISEKGPTGFNYHGGNSQNNWCVPGNQKSGVYIAPKIYKLDHSSGMKLAIIMHLYQGSTLEGSQKESSQLNKILCMMSTSMAEMSNGGEANLGDIIGDLAKSPSVQEILCKNVVRVNRKITNGTSDGADGMKKFILEDVLPLGNNVENAQAKYSSAQLRKLQNIFIALLDPVGLRDNNKTIGEFPDQLKKVVEVLNSVDTKPCSDPVEEVKLKCSTGKTMAEDKPRSPKTVVEKVPEPKSVKDETKAAPVVLSIRTENISAVVPQETKIQNTDKPEVKPEEVKIDFDKVYRNSRVIWNQLQSSLENWMEKQLSYQTVDQIPGLFEKFVDQILKQKCADLKSSVKNINGKTLADFTKHAKDRISKDFFPRFELVEKAILKFNQKVEKNFSTTEQPNHNEFSQQLSKIVKSVISSAKEDSVKNLIDLGCTKMYPHYDNLIQNREAERKRELENVGSHLMKFYQDEMKKVTESDKYFPPECLRAAHVCLVGKIEELWALTYTVAAPRNTTSALTNQLNSEFSEIEKNNLNKIAIAQKNADRLLSKMKSEYEIQMNDVLQENPEGVDDATFEAAHKKSHADVFKQFDCDAKKILRKNESLYPHMVMLKSLLDYSQSLFEGENASLREEAEEKKTLERAEEKSDFSMKEDQFQNESNTTGVVLEPMLFQFGLINYGVATVTNCDIDTKSTRAVIGWTMENEWIVGEEIGEIEADGGAIQRQWTLAELFTMTDENSSETIRSTIDIGRDVIRITPEFILGMILKLEKQRIEKNYNGFIQVVYISVPFWFPSYQRQQVLDAASIAGFKESFLFNENTAAAYFTFSSNLFNPDYNTVVISESLNKLDVAIFSYQKFSDKIFMIGHAGDYETDMSRTTDEQGWVKYIPLLGQLARWWQKSGSSKIKGEEEKLVDQLASLFTPAKTFAGRERYLESTSKVNILITCESRGWTQVLHQVAKKIPGVLDINVHHEAVLHGLNAFLKVNLRNGCPIYEYVSDGMPYYVKVRHEMGDTVVNTKIEFFSRNRKSNLKCSLSSSTRNFVVFQQNSSCFAPVLQVRIPKSVPRVTALDISLKRSRTGIISLNEMKYKSTGFSETKVFKLERENYEYVSNNMKSMEINDCRQNVHKIMSMSSVAAKLEKGRECIRSKVKSILNSINDGKGTIPSEIVKMLVTNQVKDISHNVEQTEFTLYDVNASITVLENLCTKYML